MATFCVQRIDQGLQTYLTHEVLVDSLVIVVQVGPVRLVELSTLLADNVLGQLELFEGEGQGGVVGVV